MLEDELRMSKSRAQMSSEELNRVRAQLVEKDKRVSELTSLASQSTHLKSRVETYMTEIETLRKRQREDQTRHKEEI